MSRWLRFSLLAAGLFCIGLAVVAVIGDTLASAAGETPQPNFIRLLVLSLLGGALLSASRYRR